MEEDGKVNGSIHLACGLMFQAYGSRGGAKVASSDAVSLSTWDFG